jgi:shikimate dehydrogenase
METSMAATTRLLAVYGDPIRHSLSPAMHNAALQALGWDFRYAAFHVKPQNLAVAVAAIPALNMAGVNITIPHKQTVISYLDEIIGDASRSGSVNTILNLDRRLIGMSTDGIGLLRSLREDGNFDPAGKKILILGAGGTAAAVIYSLIDAGAAALFIANRDGVRAVELQEMVLDRSGFEVEVLAWEALPNFAWDELDLLLNTAAAELAGAELPVPLTAFHTKLLVYDLVYKHGGTKLRHNAVRAGCKVLSALSLLLFQGAESFKLWFETEPPLDIMRKILNDFAESAENI